MMKPIDEIPEAWRRNQRSSETIQVIADVQEMVEKRLRLAEIIPGDPAKLARYRAESGQPFTEKVKKACRICMYDETRKKIADLRCIFQRDADRTPHWYVTAEYVEEDIDPDPNCRDCIAAGR